MLSSYVDKQIFLILFKWLCTSTSVFNNIICRGSTYYNTKNIVYNDTFLLCMYVCICVSMYVCMYVCIYVCMHVILHFYIKIAFSTVFTIFALTFLALCPLTSHSAIFS